MSLIEKCASWLANWKENNNEQHANHITNCVSLDMAGKAAIFDSWCYDFELNDPISSDQTLIFSPLDENYQSLLIFLKGNYNFRKNSGYSFYPFMNLYCFIVVEKKRLSNCQCSFKQKSRYCNTMFSRI